MAGNDDPVTKRPSLPPFFSNPWVGFIGTIASIVGVLLAVYFYALSTRSRELVYYVNPAQAVVVKTGEASKLRVLVGDRELKSDVTATQIAIWNQGRESIRSEDVLDPVKIQINPPRPILEASLRKKSRDVTNIVLDQSHLQDGFVIVSWKSLSRATGR